MRIDSFKKKARVLMVATGVCTVGDLSGLVRCSVGAALLTTDWSAAAADDIEAILLKLLKSGCRYFICVGSDAEGLHDRIDDFLVADYAAGGKSVIQVVTTFHPNESNDDIAFFLIEGSSVGLGQDQCLLALLAGTDEDQKLRDVLISA